MDPLGPIVIRADAARPCKQSDGSWYVDLDSQDGGTIATVILSAEAVRRMDADILEQQLGGPFDESVAAD